MKNRVSGPAFRLLLLLLLGSASLLTACKKDYEKIDEALIKKYIDDNKLTGAQRQNSGLYYVPVSSAASTVQPKTGQTVSVLYTGRLLDGTVFDASSRNGNKPIEFSLGRGRVIAGWDEGIALMHKGDKAMLLIPSALGYGKPGSPPTIPANSVLQFEVELVDVK
ncbi:FKBP-type peptidyl-prolyl cis-trans isomerase [Hymenobacter daecheongensis]|uniref:FKBP-type peptidyl-prolyl cis-trans isomerase n=1 Tax=Hymenobacter daecheongensis TaxID=496053 RepID=UPI00093419B2|nr:FKBP-type peptidyl-prolyl cis-trans isomerase [Hymenobacter daecheongensis]